jgi:hypothetical protein
MNSILDRRSITELEARYELEPSLQDVYVEGPTDRALVQLGLTVLNEGHQIRVYEINDVDIPAALLVAQSLPVGNKSRVIVLADELQARSSRDLRATVACLADADLDAILGRQLAHELLVYTSGLSLDAILARPSVVGKLLSVVLLASQAPDALFSQMVPILNERVLHRIACDELEIVPTSVDFTRLCTYDGTSLVCDMDTFVARLLQSAAAVELQAQFLDIINAHRPELARDPIYFVHVDDFVVLLHFCAHKIRSRATPDSTRFRRFLFGLLDASSIIDLPEIQEIVSRFGAGAP